ncbi:MAG: hypothetical protein CRN43_07630 [Candidatus Nephrothrix sp. EaCA]|nr:MAG: hypothetical protein CRN43_07630 [Candidatus Nephrothrix sp. EaCA]
MNTELYLEQYLEAMRYMDNATKMLSEKGKKKDGLYHDIKYVRAACGMAYSGLLLATECYLEMKGKPVVKKKDRRLSVEQYKENLAKVDRKALAHFNNAYRLLHLDGYYDGRNSVNLLKAGFEAAMEIFKLIAPRGVSHSKELD